MRKIKIFLFLIWLIILIAPASNSVTAANSCNWRAESTQTNPEIAGWSQTTGGCQTGETRPEYGSETQCSGTQPEGSSSGDFTTRYICCCGSIAPEPVVNPPLFEAPQLQIGLPTLDLTKKIQCTVGANGSWECPIPWIGEYVKAIYNYGLGIAGILAAIVLMAGGVVWLVSAGDASRVSLAKELISGSVTGLVILMASYVLLIQINPELVNFKPIKIGAAQPYFMKDGSDSEANTAKGACVDKNNLSNISDLVLTSAKQPFLTNAATAGLKLAKNKAKEEGFNLLVTDAYRDYATQKTLWDNALKIYKTPEATRKYVAEPSTDQCSSHMLGVAIDVCLANTVSCSHMGYKDEKNATYTDDDVKKLKTIMESAGWKPYSREWWHFQH